MNQVPALATIRERNRRKRLFGWVAIYILLVLGFAFVVYRQASTVNTLNFASGKLSLTTSKTKYTVGDEIGYTLKNGLSVPIVLTNNCPQEPLYVYSWNNSSWVRIHDKAANSTCAGKPSQVTIAANGTYTQTFADWPNLFKKPGIYRIASFASNYTAIPYADFQVVAKPVAPETQTQIVIQKVITPIYITVPSSGGGGGDD